ncbi:hypothetical protein ARMSODRAFT_1027261 [Armillaria solidipes]|uniref:Uncharacterized protein n=1 Tax=Armillaria solidipes TaxID=1076256 RepID=A0A2H3AL89_9AGAR|nr:hypothetical protein ARMSODRAFT_1027261 [Armillaria solidipes]
MSLEDVLSALISSGYEPCPTEPMPPGNDLTWTAYPELSHYFENASPLSSTSSSNSDDSLQSQSASPPNFQPNEVAFTLPDASRSFDALDVWSTDACFDGINRGRDATNTYQDHAVDFDHRVDDGMGFSAIAGSISPDATTHDSVQGSAFCGDYPLSFVRGRDDSEYHSQGNGAYGHGMSLPCCNTHAGMDRKELIGTSGLGTGNVYLEPPRMAPPSSSQVYLQNPDNEHMRKTDSTYLVESHPSSEHAILTTPPNAITFNGSASTQMDADSLISGPSTETSAPTSFLQVHELSPARPHAAHSTSLYMPFIDAYAAVSSSKTIPNRAFDQDQASGQPVAIMDAKFNSFGRIGGSTVSKRDSKKLHANRIKKSPLVQKSATTTALRESSLVSPPFHFWKKFQLMTPRYSADGRHKYERLTDFQIEKLLKNYNVTRDQAPRVFYGLRRQHSLDVLYTCLMDKAQHTLS